MNLNQFFGRVWEGVWCSDSGDAISSEDIDAACTLEGPMLTRDRDFEPFIGGLDLGLKHDHSALIVLGLDMLRRRFRLAHCESWAPPMRGGKIRLEVVKEACKQAAARFNLMGILFDPWQCEFMAEQLSNEGVRMYKYPFTPKNCDAMATSLLDAFSNRRIDLYRDPALIRDLGKLSIVERQKGFKLEATRDEYGHCDRATALAMLLPWANEIFQGVFQFYHEPEPEILRA